ncbi:hypothetical protein LY90DRAFT_513520 [Neocallimastix californiae]|uniref:Uncharacterized protein n=1 Tax=Neocallimastix californiae TaxID=1754190 RepID=A0A1Y2AZ52_9FUNG|nr:hypothetical protein LY90DRAFT_513520 [Neocallimastix californiae]|eukprot:ORY27135.1 hypothetical protein LY90DRAFT_513520 [Neocallimastix californiae]
MIINILKVFENSFTILENFNPVAVDNASTANDEDILRVEKACYRRMPETINIKRSPDYIKDFSSNVIQNIKFTKLIFLLPHHLLSHLLLLLLKKDLLQGTTSLAPLRFVPPMMLQLIRHVRFLK